VGEKSGDIIAASREMSRIGTTLVPSAKNKACTETQRRDLDCFFRNKFEVFERLTETSRIVQSIMKNTSPQSS
jgi:hypothetical protein